MTIEIAGPENTLEHSNANKLRKLLLESNPLLLKDGIECCIVPQVYAAGCEIDCVLLFNDNNDRTIFKTSNGVDVRSFVLCIEIKNHSSDFVRKNGTHLEVKYNDAWKSVTNQIGLQIWSLRTFQKYPYIGKKSRDNTYVNSAIWFPRLSPENLNSLSYTGHHTKILYNNITWQDLIDGLEINRSQGIINTFTKEQTLRNHSFGSLKEILTARIDPTKLDLDRVNSLTQKRFDSEKQSYVRDLGKGLLIFRGRAGTGKTFALLQMAIHIARSGKTARLVTYNHGLLSDISRSIEIIKTNHPDIVPVPIVSTRWMLMHDLFLMNFGDYAEKCSLNIANLEDREKLFLDALVNQKSFLNEPLPCLNKERAFKRCECDHSIHKTWNDICHLKITSDAPYDFLLVDEGQDWNPVYRDLIFEIFGSQNVIVADGVDQFVDKLRCEWDLEDVVKNRIVPLRTSRRTKAATCDTVSDIARALNVPGWDVEADQEVTGGRLTVFVESSARLAINRALDLLQADLASQPKMRPVDALLCLPNKEATPGANYCNLFENVQDGRGADYWRGYDWDTRRNREYPSRQGQLRAVLYQSCRGMEGWTSICMGLDLLYDYLLSNPEIDEESIRENLKAEMGFLFNESDFDERIRKESELYAINWIMIAITRSMDHLIIHISDKDSTLGKILQKIDPDKITWK